VNSLIGNVESSYDESSQVTEVKGYSLSFQARNLICVRSIRTWRNLQLVPILSFWYPVRSEKAVLRWARGQPGTDMSRITIPTHHITSDQSRLG
jgi:hypothetical protein